jgi:hypothetical protein
MKLFIGLAAAVALATVIVFGTITSAQVAGRPDASAIAPALPPERPPDLSVPPPDNPAIRDLSLVPTIPSAVPGGDSVPAPGGLQWHPSNNPGQSPNLPPTPGTVPYPLH